MPMGRDRYPPNWDELRQRVLERAGNRCEGSPLYPDCRAENGKPHPVTGSRVMLTTAHLFDNDTMTQDIGRLRFWCQRCHLAYDRPKHLAVQRKNRLARKDAVQPSLFQGLVPER